MTFFSKDYSPDQIVSLHIKELIIPINIFLNLKSLHIVCDTQKEEEEWVDIIQQVRILNHEFAYKFLRCIDFRTVSIGQLDNIIIR
jgi:hypothetical protein